MRKGGGHGKGAAFEREIAKQIAKAFKCFGIRQKECWRSVLSGGHSMSSGDLVMSRKLERLFPYVPEMKFWKKIEWWHFLVSGKQRHPSWKEWQWVKQAEDGARKHPDDLAPLLVMKCNHEKVMVLVPCGEEFATVKTDREFYRLMLFSVFLKLAVRRALRASN